MKRKKAKLNREAVFAFLLFTFALSSSCTTKPTDLRTHAPAETLVYLETDDLAAALQPIVDSKPFREVAKTKPDFSALKGVQLAVAVTGFETSEVSVTDEHSVAKVHPRFVAIADTHAWNYQAVAFAEKKLASFVADIYDSEPKLEKSDKYGGKYFTWSPSNNADGRKAFALVVDSLIYFGNDETAIDKCLAVRRAEADSIAKTGKLPPRVPNSLANGYVSTDGVAQIAALAGIQFASQVSDDEDVQSAVAGILPQIIRGTVTDISWTATKAESGIEDKYVIGMPDDLAAVFSETLRAAPDRGGSEMFIPQNTAAYFIPADAISISRYNPANAQIALRSLLFAFRSKLDPFSGKILAEFSSIIFEPYAIRDGEAFLGLVDSEIVTARLADDEDSVIAIARSKPESDPNTAVSREIDLKKKWTPASGAIYWTSDDNQLAYARTGTYTLSGDKQAVLRCLEPPINRPNLYRSEIVNRFFSAKDAIATTLTNDRTTTTSLVAVLAREGHGETQVVSTDLTETRFTETGMERRTVSDFGFIGWMIAQLTAE